MKRADVLFLPHEPKTSIQVQEIMKFSDSIALTYKQCNM